MNNFCQLQVTVISVMMQTFNTDRHEIEITRLNFMTGVVIMCISLKLQFTYHNVSDYRSPLSHQPSGCSITWPITTPGSSSRSLSWLSSSIPRTWTLPGIAGPGAWPAPSSW